MPPPEEFSVLAAAFTPSTTAVAGSLPLSALFGLLPLALFFVMLGVFKIATHWRALGSLAVALLIAAFGFKMPLGLAALAPTQGLTFGLLVICYIVVAAVWLYNLSAALKATDLKIPWPGLDGRLLTPAGEVSGDTVLSISTLASPGTMLILASLVVTIVYSVNSSGGRFPFSMSKGIATLGRTVIGLRMAILTISAVMALAYTMNFSGQTVAIGTALAATGTTFAFFAPVLGWIGTAVTGSATSAGARFASLHSAVAAQTGLSPQLLLSVNEIGGGIGKIVSPQNLAIAATAVKREGLEPELLRRAAPYSIGLLLLLSIITTLASVGVLGFIIAG